jgi:hypothetical protein
VIPHLVLAAATLVVTVGMVGWLVSLERRISRKP